VEKVQICQFQEKLIVGILQAHVQAASNKTIYPGSIMKLESLKKEYSKTERSRGIGQAMKKVLSKLMVDFMHRGSNNCNGSVVITATNVS
jgi:hypothetical protein